MERKLERKRNGCRERFCLLQSLKERQLNKGGYRERESHKEKTDSQTATETDDSHRKKRDNHRKRNGYRERYFVFIGV